MLHYYSFSQTILVGRLGQDSKLQTMKNGKTFLVFSVGTSYSVRDANGQNSHKTDWHDCMVFGSRAEKLAPMLLKGTSVSVQGTISYREVVLQNGYKGKTASILVDDLQILAKPANAAPMQANHSVESEPSYDDENIC